jgi:hypothetical protein
MWTPPKALCDEALETADVGALVTDEDLGGPDEALAHGGFDGCPLRDRVPV